MTAADLFKPMQETASDPSEGTHYRAFISYSHGDNREVGRQWADWLHHSLETYEIPADLIGKPNAHGQPIPAQIFPVFQDEKELSANADLSASLKDALDRSAFLVFLASPRSANSVYVQEEIRHFKQAGKAKQIIAVILRGEPEYGQATTDAQCFPDVLRYGIGSDGQLNKAQTDEALAADVRLPHSQDEGFTSVEAYRQHLSAQGVPSAEIKSRTQAYGERLNLAKLKVISTILGVPLADLTHRDQTYQLERMRRRHRVVVGVAAGMGALALLAGGAGFVAWQQKGQAQQNFALTLYTSGLNKLAQNEYGDPAAYIAASVRGGNANAAAFAQSMLASREDLTSLPNIGLSQISFSPDGRYLAGRSQLGASAQRLQIWDVKQRKMLAEVPDPMVRAAGRPHFDSQNRVYFSDEQSRVRRYDMATRQTETVFENPDRQSLRLDGVSPDGAWLGLWRYQVGRWLVAVGGQAPVAKLDDASQAVGDISFAPNSSLATLCAESAERESSCLIVPLNGPDKLQGQTVTLNKAPRWVSFSPVGQAVAFWRGDALDVWRAGELKKMERVDGILRWVGFNADGESLAAVQDAKTQTLRVSDGALLNEHRLPVEAIKSLLPDQVSDAASPDAAHTAVTRNARLFLHQSGPTPALEAQLTYANTTKRIASDAQGKYLYSFDKGGRSVARGEMDSHVLEPDFVVEPGEIDNIVPLPSGALATVLADHTVRIHAPGAKADAVIALKGQGRPIFNHDGSQISLRTGPKSMSVWQTADGKEVLKWETEGSLSPFVLDPSFKRMLHADPGRWRVTDLASRKVLLEGQEAPSLVAFSPDGALLAMADKGGKVTVWDVGKGQAAFSVPSIATPLLRFSPDGKVLVVSEDARRVKLVNTGTGQVIGQVIPVSSASRWLEFSSDSRRLFVQDAVGGGLTPSIKVVDSHNGNLISMPFASGLHQGVVLVNDDTQLITIDVDVGGVVARRWRIPGGLQMAPEQIANDLENYYGRKYDEDSGAIQTHASSTNFRSWFFEDTYTRSVTPSAKTSVIDDIEAQLPLNSGRDMQSLAGTSLYHPLARAGIAEYLSRQPGLDALTALLVRTTELQLKNDAQKRGEAADARLAGQTRVWLDKARAGATAR